MVVAINWLGLMRRGGKTLANVPGIDGRKMEPSIKEPLRLRICTCNCQSAPSDAITRNGAGEASSWADSGRNRKTGQSQDWAWTCNRRNCSARAWGSQARMAPPRGLAFTSCSVVHKRSAGVSAAIQTRFFSAIPSFISPGACGRLGGPTNKIWPPVATKPVSEGDSSRHSHSDGWG